MRLLLQRLWWRRARRPGSTASQRRGVFPPSARPPRAQLGGPHARTFCIDEALLHISANSHPPTRQLASEPPIDRRIPGSLRMK